MTQLPDDIHGTTRGKLYKFRDDGRCNECLVEAAERQSRGFAFELPRRAVIAELILGPLLPPRWDSHWTLCGTVKFEEPA